MIQSVKLAQGSGFVVTLDDGTVLHVPDDTGNRNRREVQDWINDGNMPLPADPLPSPPPNRDTALDTAIDGATSFTALKAVLKGRVKAR